MSDVEQARRLFFEALAFVDSSDFQNAESRLRDALPFSPGSVSILTNLAVVLLRQNKRAEAREFAERAAAAKPGNIEAMLVLADCRAKDGEFTEALAILEKIVALDPTVAEAHNNIGLVLRRRGRFADALASCDRAIALVPGLADAHMNRGHVLCDLNRYEEALASYEKVHVLKPHLAEAWLCRGNVLSSLLRYDQARAACRRALSLQPNMFEALQALALLSLSGGNIAEALDLALRALAANETPEARSLVASCLGSPLIHPGLGDLRELLVRALSQAWARPSELAHAGSSFLTLNPAIRELMARAVEAWPKLVPADEALLAKLAEDRLLRALLESAPIYGVELEQLATGLRCGLLAAARSGGAAPEPVLGLYGALARQCFINNFVFAQSDAELEQVRALRDTLVAALASGAAIAALSLVAVAAYLPLHALPHPELLLDRAWPEAVNAVLEQQVRAPLEEQRLRATIPVLTTIDDAVSKQVRGQYEENPYPQWVKPSPAGKPQTVDVRMREKFPLSSFAETGKSGGIDVLVAGCGTGQHAVEAAQRFTSAQVLAVDLSLASLSYAQRQTSALGLDNICYAQADILNLPSIGRTFDVIEAGGVLHHLADPLAGWRALLSLLRPGGLMLLGFYSAMGRQDVVAARDFIAARGYRPTADDIRRCRQELLGCAGGTPLKNATLFTDFFSLSECRDLLFHVQEHRLALPQLADFIAGNDLRFLGFDLDWQTRRSYARQFPGDLAMTDLAQWHRYETANPRAFSRMYQFWVQKK